METSLIIIYILLGLIIILSIWIISLEIRLKKIFRGKSASSLESVIRDMGKTLDEIIEKGENDDALFKDIYKRLKKTLQKTHTIRFNPFRDHGGNQSFATSIMDEDGDGVIISSLYSRDKVGVYAKPLSKFNSSYELSDEEKESIKIAKDKKI